MYLTLVPSQTLVFLLSQFHGCIGSLCPGPANNKAVHVFSVDTHRHTETQTYARTEDLRDQQRQHSALINPQTCVDMIDGHVPFLPSIWL